MDNLNKENFWDNIEKKYPNAMNIFHKWIDKYKQDNNWTYLFRCEERWNHQKILVKPIEPKYHELPLAMQMGIWCQFEAELGDMKEQRKEFRDNTLFTISKVGVEQFLENLECQIKN